MSPLPELTPSQERLLSFLKALGSETRQQILMRVYRDRQEHTVGEVAAKLRIGQSTASQHLAILKRGGVLRSERRGKEVYYSVDSDRIRRSLDQLRAVLDCYS